MVFGSLLLLGGRVADYVGRRRMFVIGLIGFGLASALGGLAQNQAMLFSSRALQGGFAAIMAPAALSILTVTFTEPHERLGLCCLRSDRRQWCRDRAHPRRRAHAVRLVALDACFINTPIAIVTAVMARRVISESRAEKRHSLRPSRRRDTQRSGSFSWLWLY